MLKKCFKCGEEKEQEEFYKHSEMADGHLGKCKQCTKQDVRDNYLLRIGQYTEYERKRRQSEERKERALEYQKERRRNFPEKNKSYLRVSRAISNGVITKMPCELCQEEKVEAHHYDYSKPLDVWWLCFPCHLMVHGKEARGRT